MKKILVIGSLSTDFVVTTNQKPGQGETVFGESFATAYGGKGANQAVAAARLDIQTSMIGCVGDDVFGEKIRENLAKNQIAIENVEPVTHFSSGSAHITLFEGDNSIIVVPAANNQLTPEKIEKLTEIITAADLVIIQNEIPQETNLKIIEICQAAQIKIIYNPAPARELPAQWLEKIDYLTPNEHEFEIIFPQQKLSAVLKKYPNKLIVTLGTKGAIFFDGEKEVLVPAFSTQAADTTGAGDTFNGALATAILKNLELEAALKFANLAASISVQKFGAQGGMPTIAEMKESEHFEKKWDVE